MNELSASAPLWQGQEELPALLARQARLYTMGDSDSLPVETAEELLRSIQFCAACGNPSEKSLAQRFESGQRAVWEDTEKAKALYGLAKDTAPAYGSIAYRDTLDALNDFFRLYDMRFFAHGIPCMIDYPLCLPVPEDRLGVLYIGEYLRRLIIENRFCGCFPRENAVRLLAAHHPEYRGLVLNLFEPILAAALGHALLGKDAAALRLTAADCDALFALLRPWDAARARRLLDAALQRLCALHAPEAAAASYLRDAAYTLLPRLQTVPREGYRGLFAAE